MRWWIREIRHGLRMLLSKPITTLVAVFTLALGMGAVTAIWSVVDAVLLKPLPYPDTDRLVRIFGTVEARGEDRSSTSLPDFFDWREANRSLASVSAFVRWSYNVIGSDRPERLWGGMVTYDFFDTLGMQPVLGRTFLPAEDQPGAGKVVVIGYGLWQTLFGGRQDVLGQTLRIDDNDHLVVGVMPPELDVPDDAQLWTPLGFGPDSYPRALHFLRIVARLRPEVGLTAAQTEMTAMAAHLAESYPETNEGRGAVLVPLLEHMVGDVKPALLVLLGAAGLVLLIACGNVANLLLAQLAERAGEISLRRALGASRRRVIAQFLVEGLLLSFAAAALGLLFALVMTDTLVALGPQDVPRLDQVTLDGRAFAFAGLVAVLTAVFFGFLPLVQLSRRNLGSSLRDTENASPAAGGVRLRQALIVAEVAVAFSLMIGAGLLIRSFGSLLDVDPGFRTEDVLTLEVALPWSKYPQGQQTAAFYSELLESVAALPGGVRAAAVAWNVPLGERTGSTSFEIEGRPASASGEKNVGSIQPVSEDYFQTLGVTLLDGRAFTGHDDAEAPPVVVVNEALKKRYWPDRSPVGEYVTFDVDFGPVGSIEAAKREIVGVVADYKNSTLAAPTEPEMYVPYKQASWRMMSLLVHASGDPGTLAQALREKVWAIDPYQPVSQATTLESLLAGSVAQTKFNMLLLSFFAGTALILAMVGIFGVISYSVSQRTHEIGLRMALGARHGHVIRNVVSQGLWLTSLGLGLGLAAALAGGRVLAGLLFGVAATDTVTFLGVALAAGLVASVASYLPARRATRIDPMVALRCE